MENLGEIVKLLKVKRKYFGRLMPSTYNELDVFWMLTMFLEIGQRRRELMKCSRNLVNNHTEYKVITPTLHQHYSSLLIHNILSITILSIFMLMKVTKTMLAAFRKNALRAIQMSNHIHSQIRIRSRDILNIPQHLSRLVFIVLM